MDTNQLERVVLEDQDLFLVESVPYVYHCHHYNLFHDQTVDDALGEDDGIEFRTSASQSAAHQLLAAVTEKQSFTSSTERVQAAARLFQWMGHGRLDLGGDHAEGEDLHYGHSWREKYGAKVKRLHPADAFAAGFCAATEEVAQDLPVGSLWATESECIALRAPRCKFELSEKKGSAGDFRSVDRASLLEHVGATLGGEDEERVATIAKGLQEFVRGVAGDDRGLVQAFGVYVTMHPSNYYNLTAYEAVHRIEKTVPAALPVVESLLREAGHVCVFNTFGNVLMSPEWEGMVGSLSGEVADTVSFCAAIARGLGFGRWSVGELVPGERLVLRASSNYESPFYLAQYGKSDCPRCYIFQGAALAIMLLAHAVDWKSRPQLTPELYASLFKSGKLPWKVEETRCRSRGDDFCEVVVTAA